MFQRPARLFQLFVSQGQIVVRVRVGGRQLQRRQVGFDRISHTPGLLEHISQIKMRQGISRIYPQRLAIVLFGRFVILAVVIKRAQIDVSGSVFRIKLQHALIGRDRL